MEGDGALDQASGRLDLTKEEAPLGARRGLALCENGVRMTTYEDLLFTACLRGKRALPEILF